MGISFRILKFQGICGDKICIVFDESAWVDDTINPLSSGDLKMVIAFWANLQISFDDPSINDFITRIAFDPKVFGELKLLPIPLFFFLFFLLKPSHLFSSSLLSNGVNKTNKLGARSQCIQFLSGRFRMVESHPTPWYC
jgi:hypothetical protein